MEEIYKGDARKKKRTFICTYHDYNFERAVCKGTGNRIASSQKTVIQVRLLT